MIFRVGMGMGGVGLASGLVVVAAMPPASVEAGTDAGPLDADPGTAPTVLAFALMVLGRSATML
jgi:hypothetical protein